MAVNINFRLEKETLKKLDDLAFAKGLKRSKVLRDAVEEYLGLYVVGSEPTIGRLYRRLLDIEKRLTALENLILKKGAESVM